ncbi:hypothetical protein NHX12_022728 [Muraenolepis orangiensis]|uniref:BICC1 first type I KH domain-containing protein n=1 Tax=Muraenolepis orangiensis TaxID=630683 RepID=A0A9Q0ERK2_9TELE|nr:hypothetical protein NHX12_022728 [Muraenolepis orangiensis]
MAALQCDTLSGYLQQQQQQQSDQGSNSERSTDSPLPGSEDDLNAPHPLPDPEWTEERFRVDRKKLEIMLLGITPTRQAAAKNSSAGQEVMDETKTQIAWPSKLKIGAKSKKGQNRQTSPGHQDPFLSGETKASGTRSRLLLCRCVPSWSYL